MQGLKELKRKLEDERVVLGAVVSSSDPTICEGLGFAGYDFLWIDAEHNGLDYSDIMGHIIAASSGGTASFIRVRKNEPDLVKPILDMGADGIIFPMIKTLSDAEKAVRSCLYPPKGIRGIGPGRAVRYGIDDPLEYIHSKAESSVFRILQVENAECVKNLEKIIEVEGIDVLMIGPSDLSASVGRLGEIKHPEMVRMIDKICKTAAESGVRLGAFAGSDPDTLNFFLERGVEILAIGADRGFLMNGAKSCLEKVRSLL